MKLNPSTGRRGGLYLSPQPAGKSRKKCPSAEYKAAVMSDTDIADDAVLLKVIASLRDN